MKTRDILAIGMVSIGLTALVGCKQKEDCDCRGQITTERITVKKVYGIYGLTDKSIEENGAPNIFRESWFEFYNPLGEFVSFSGPQNLCDRMWVNNICIYPNWAPEHQDLTAVNPRYCIEYRGNITPQLQNLFHIASQNWERELRSGEIYNNFCDYEP